MILTVLALALPSLGYAIYSYLKSLRSIFINMPSLERSFLFGNILEMAKYVKPNQHIDYALEQIYEDLNQPDLFVLDVAPIFRVLIIASPMIAEQVSRPSPKYPYSLPKSWTMQDILPLVGKQSIISSEGEDWKSKRKQFQPGFQPKHLQTLLPLIINETKHLVSELSQKAESDKHFQLGQVIQNLTLDVITGVVLGHSIQAQLTPEGQGVKGPKGVLTAFRGVQYNFIQRGSLVLYNFSPARMWRLFRYERILDQHMQNLIADAVRDPDPSSRAVVNLALKDRPLTPETLQDAADQLRTFIFAGFDTTSSALQWTFYYLSLPSNSAILDALYAEHDEILGPVNDEDRIEAVLRTDPSLPYTTAVIKEALRMQPPAGSARWVQPSAEPFFLTASDGTRYQINGTPVYINHKIIFGTTKIWGPDAKVFRPERWLDKEYVANLPSGAFRPFERGPRACIGQELAMMEAKVVLALVARRFLFKKWTPPEEVGSLGDAWNVYKVTATPYDSMRMTVKKR